MRDTESQVPISAGIPISAHARAMRRKMRPDEIVAQVEGRRDASIRAYSIERRYRWPRAQHMVYGRQWVDWNPKLGEWVPKPLERDRAVTRNHLRSRVETRTARQVSSRPHFSCLPARQDPESRRAARMAEWLLEHDWWDLDMYLARYTATLCEALFGMGIIKVYRDANAGGVQIDPKIYLGVDGYPLPMSVVETFDKREIESASWKGKNVVEAVLPHAFLPPPGVIWPNLRLCPWLIHRTLMSKEEIKEVYDVDVEIDGSGDTEDSDYATALARDLHRFTFHHYAEDTQWRTDKLQVDMYYELASPQKGYEYGKLYVIAGGKLLNGPDGEPLDYDQGRRYPFFLFPAGLIEPGCFFPPGWVDAQLDCQVGYNQSRTRQKRHESILFGPHVLNPSTSGIPDDWFGGAFKVLQYQAYGGDPKYLVPPPVPAESYNSLSRDLEDMAMISGLHGFSMGQQQQGSPSAQLAQTLIEADASDLGPTLSLHARAWEGVGYADIDLHRRHSSSEELMAIVGHGGYPEAHSFKGSELSADIIVRVQEDSLQPVLKGQRQQATFNAIDRGLYGSPAQFDAPTRTFLLSHVGQPVGRMGVDDPEMMERRYAERENYRIIEEKQNVPTRPGLENDELHLRVHLERCNDADADAWDEETTQRMQQHIQGHQQSVAQQQQQMLQSQQEQARIQQGLAIEGQIKSQAGQIAGEALAKELLDDPRRDDGSGPEGGGEGRPDEERGE